MIFRVGTKHKELFTSVFLVICNLKDHFQRKQTELNANIKLYRMIAFLAIVLPYLFHHVLMLPITLLFIFSLESMVTATSYDWESQA